MENENKVSPPPETEAAQSQGLTTLNLSNSVSTSQSAEAAAFRRHMQSGARWFFWIAGLSLINSIAAVTNSNWSFLAGLGITQFISGIAQGVSDDTGSTATIVAFVLNALVAGFFVFLGVFAYKGHLWAFIAGLVVYALDALIFLVVQLWFPLAFHVFVIYCLYRGLAANRKLSQLNAELATQT